MATIQDIRKQYPQYNDMSDQELADSFHDKFYSDMPKDQFYAKVGYKPQSTTDKLLSDAKSVGQYALGAYSGAMNPVFGTASLINQGLNKALGTNIPLPQKRELSQSQAYQAGQPLGEMAAYGAMTAVPGAGAVPTLARLGGGALYGASMSPNASSGAAQGATMQGVLESIPGVVGKVAQVAPKALDFMRPQKSLDAAMKNLAGGKNVNDITQSLASDIKGSAKAIQNQYKEMLKPVQDQASGYNLYQSKAGFVPNTYKQIAKENKDAFLGDAKKYHTEFLENPTFDNAHKLQSQLGAVERGLKGSDVATAEAKSTLRDLRNAVKADTNNFLNKQDLTGGLAKQYNAASDYYLNEYVPYKNIKSLMDVMGNKGSTSSSLINAFKNPKLTADERGISDALKVANDIGDTGKNKIIALHLAKKSNLTPKKALSAYEDLENSGLSEYRTKSLDELMKDLGGKQKNLNNAKFVAKYAGIPLAATIGLKHLAHPTYNYFTGGQ